MGNVLSKIYFKRNYEFILKDFVRESQPIEVKLISTTWPF